MCKMKDDQMSQAGELPAELVCRSRTTYDATAVMALMQQMVDLGRSIEAGGDQVLTVQATAVLEALSALPVADTAVQTELLRVALGEITALTAEVTHLAEKLAGRDTAGSVGERQKALNEAWHICVAHADKARSSSGSARAMACANAIQRLAAASQPVDAAQAVPVEQTDLAKRLSEMANSTNSEVSVLCVSKADLLALCSETNRYYGGMMAWKKTAEKKDADWNAERMARVDERCASRLATAAAQAVPEGWIEVAERLPTAIESDDGTFPCSPCDSVICAIWVGDWLQAWAKQRYCEDGQWRQNDLIGFVPTHWQALPAAPQPTDTTTGA